MVHFEGKWNRPTRGLLLTSLFVFYSYINNKWINWFVKWPFIASVNAKDGVAVIADSLVTTSEQVINRDVFIEYTNKIKVNLPPNPAAMLTDLSQLFSFRKSYTKDFEEKLIQYDDYTCITFTGSASINGIKINKLIYDLIEKNRNKNNIKRYNRKRILTKVKDFKIIIESEAKKHIRKYGSIGDITFIVTHWDKKNKKSHIYKVDLKSSDKSVINGGKEFVLYNKTYDWEKVVSDGQNRISDKILMGKLSSFFSISKSIAPIIAENILKKLNINKSLITEKFLKNVSYIDKIPNELFDETKITKLELSLQQATDLAALLMRVEIDFQQYTEAIPTVGGVIRLATISDKGVEFHSGKDIIKPRNI